MQALSWQWQGLAGEQQLRCPALAPLLQAAPRRRGPRWEPEIQSCHPVTLNGQKWTSARASKIFVSFVI